MSQRWRILAGRRARLLLMIAASAVAGVAGVSIALAATGGGAGARALPARNFTVPVLGHPGQQLSLRSYAGKPVIVNFFASWCTPCQHETPLLARFYRGRHGRVTMIGIDVNDPAAAALGFVHRTGVSYPVGVDAPPMPTSAAYNVNGLPQTFFLNGRHQIVKRVFGAVTSSQLTAGTAMIDPGTK